MSISYTTRYDNHNPDKFKTSQSVTTLYNKYISQELQKKIPVEIANVDPTNALGMCFVPADKNAEYHNENTGVTFSNIAINIEQTTQNQNKNQEIQPVQHIWDKKALEDLIKNKPVRNYIFKRVEKLPKGESHKLYIITDALIRQGYTDKQHILSILNYFAINYFGRAEALDTKKVRNALEYPFRKFKEEINRGLGFKRFKTHKSITINEDEYITSNKIVYNELVGIISNHRTIYIKATTGAGKTHFINHIRGKYKTIFVAPTRIIAEQTLVVWYCTK